ALQTHFWFLVRALPRKKPTESDRIELQSQVQHAFHQQFGADQEGNILIAHSCRSIFYYIIRYLLAHADNAKRNNDNDSNKPTIRICLPSLHFGSFYRLLRGMEKSMDCCIEFYEVDFISEKDLTLDQDAVDEDEFKKCDLLLCQNLFGLPLKQDRLIQLAKKYDIPILEDCVQSGSLFGKYRGSPEADIVIYSGGLDKTPSCFGGGFGFFRKTSWGDEIFKFCHSLHEALPVDTWQQRFTTCCNIMIHLMIAKNSFGFNNLIGLVSYVWLTERGEFINWYAISLKIRKAKAISPFQHAESGFLRRPSTYQLHSMLYGFSKKQQMKDMAKHEELEGISEFTWVISPIGDRMHLCQFLNDHFMVLMINTTWEADEKSKSTVGRHINNNLVYLPNINELNTSEIAHVGKALTAYCQELETSGEHEF
ncbi:MAG: hypothetical protein SGILL_009054, partial [Bacillariaceae sp.]